MSKKVLPVLALALSSALFSTSSFAVTGTVSNVIYTAGDAFTFKFSGSAVNYIVDDFYDPGVYQPMLHLVNHAYTSAKTLNVTTHDCDSNFGVSWCYVSAGSY